MGKAAWEQSLGVGAMSYVTHFILSQLLSRLPMVPPIAVEVSRAAALHESHVLHLSVAEGWRVVLFSTAETTAASRLATAVGIRRLESFEGVCRHLASQRVPPVFGVLRVDVDYVDPHLVEHALLCGYRPAAIVFSFAREFAADDVCAMGQWVSSGVYSLGWWRAVLLRHGYAVVSTLLNSGFAVASERLPHLGGVLDDTLMYPLTGPSLFPAAPPEQGEGGSTGEEATPQARPPTCVVDASGVTSSRVRRGETPEEGRDKGSVSLPSLPPLGLEPERNGGEGATGAPQLQDHLPPIYVVNLPHREDRRAESIAELVGRAGYPPSLVRFVPGVAVPEKGTLGCALAHLRAVQRAAARNDGLEHFIVMEDDISLVFPQNFTATVAWATRTLGGGGGGGGGASFPYDVLLLSTRCAHRVATSLPPPLVRVRGSVSAGAYMMRKGYAPTFLRILMRSVAGLVASEPGDIRMVFDQLFKDNQMSDSWLSLRPSPIKQRASDSDATGKKGAAYTFKDLDEEGAGEACFVSEGDYA